MYIPQFFYPLPYWWIFLIFFYFSFGLLRIELPWIHLYKSLKDICFNFSVECLVVEWLSHIIKCLFTFIRNCKQFSKVKYLFTCPPAVYLSSSYFYQHLVLWIFLSFSYYCGFIVVLFVVLNVIFLMISDIEHLFCLTIHVFFCEVYIKILTIFYLGCLSSFLIVRFTSIFGLPVICQIHSYITSIFSQPVACLFFFLI